MTWFTDEGQSYTSVASMVSDLLAGLDVAYEDILEMTVVGNPVMLHFLLGVDPRGLGQAPYVGLFKKLTSARARSLGLPMHPAGRVLLLPQIAGFLGSDIIACLLAVDDSAPDSFLLVDIGTNGEMVLKHGNRMVACSVAAAWPSRGNHQRNGGPWGQLTGFGWTRELKHNVIGFGKPEGICGSGLVDLLRYYWIWMTG